MIVMGHRPSAYRRLKRQLNEPDLGQMIESHYHDVGSSDLGEVATSWLTHRAGQRLGLWHDSTPIIEQCARSLMGSPKFNPAWVFQQVQHCEPTQRQVTQLIRWFKGDRSA